MVETPTSGPNDLNHNPNGDENLSAQILAAGKEKLRSLLSEVDGNLWEAGDLIGQLIKAGANLAELSAETGWSMPRLSNIHRTAEAFPDEQRDSKNPFFAYE